MNFFEQAIKHTAARNIVLPDDYYDVKNKALRSASFSVAGIDKANILTKVLETLVKNLESGETFEAWQKAVKSDGLLDLPKHRLKTIYQTNIQQAFNAARSENIYSNETIQYVMFDSVNDTRTTSGCRKIDGFVVEKTDEILARCSPALHYRCRTSLVPLTKFTGEKRRKTWEETRKKQGKAFVPDFDVHKDFDYDKRVLQKKDFFKGLELAQKEAETLLEKTEKKLGVEGIFNSIVNFFKKVFE